MKNKKKDDKSNESIENEYSSDENVSEISESDTSLVDQSNEDESNNPSENDELSEDSEENDNKSDNSKDENDNETKFITEKGTTFEDLGLHSWMCDHLSKMNIVVPTLIQEKCIPKTLEGKDIIGMSQTGSGKTAAFALPIIHDLSKNMYGVFAVILTPTRELGHQIVQHIKALCGYRLRIRISLIVGGTSEINQAREIETKPHIIIGTPGRVAAAIEQFSNDRVLKKIKYLVFDEADRLLSASFAEEMERILKACNPYRQTLLYSATMNDDVKRLSQIALQKKIDQTYVYDACKMFTVADNLRQYYIFMPQLTKDCYLYCILKHCEENQKIAMVFFSEIKECEIVCKMCELLDIRSGSLHSVKSQGSRIEALDSFRKRDITALFTTDVGNRGLDIPAVDFVINYDIPDTTEEYIHRVGRSARAGRAGAAINLVTPYDVERLKSIEESTKVVTEEFKHESVYPPERVEKYISDVAEKRIHAKIELIDSGFIEEHIEKKENSKKESERRKEILMTYEKKYNEMLKQRWNKNDNRKTNSEVSSDTNKLEQKPKHNQMNNLKPKNVEVSGLTLLGKRKRIDSNLKKSKRKSIA